MKFTIDVPLNRLKELGIEAAVIAKVEDLKVALNSLSAALHDCERKLKAAEAELVAREIPLDLRPEEPAQ